MSMYVHDEWQKFYYRIKNSLSKSIESESGKLNAGVYMEMKNIKRRSSATMGEVGRYT